MSSRVLIVEDDTWQREHVAETLVRHGFVVGQSAHALEAIGQVDTFRPDVIILDMMLPGVNGIVLLHELQSHADLAAIPVIVMSTRTDMTLAELEPYGVKALLDKSTIQPSDIVAAVRKVL